MIDPENLTRCLLTPTIVGQELAWVTKGNDYFVDARQDRDGLCVWDIGCNGKPPVRLTFEPADLLMSLDAFSAKHIQPIADRFRDSAKAE